MKSRKLTIRDMERVNALANRVERRAFTSILSVPMKNDVDELLKLSHRANDLFDRMRQRIRSEFEF